MWAYTLADQIFNKIFNFKAQLTSSMRELDQTIGKVLGNKNWQHERDQSNLGIQDLKKEYI